MMISLRVKKKFNQIIAGTVAAAMTLTMVPDVWMPVYADSVRNEIAEADINTYENNVSDSLDGLDPYSEEYKALKFSFCRKFFVFPTKLRHNMCDQICLICI